MRSGTQVAVKVMDQDESIAKASGLTTKAQFDNELAFLLSYQHPNLLQLLGTCREAPKYGTNPSRINHAEI